LITSDHSLQELRIHVGALQHVLHHLKAELLLIWQKQLGLKFCRNFFMAKSSVKVVLGEPLLIPNSSATSRTVKRRSYMINICTLSMTSAFLFIGRLLERWSLYADMRHL
jgi:hypothetical protein